MPGAEYLGAGLCRFKVWAPFLRKAAVTFASGDMEDLPMNRDQDGYWQVEANEIEPGRGYFYKLDGNLARADPASNFQPDGVHGPSEIVDHNSFHWSDSGWKGIPQEELIFYEMHVGTFTPEGTFDAAIRRLPDLKDLGITAVELMPVAQFPGERNWGYDGVYLFAPQNSYGGPQGLKRLVNACHEQQLAVVLDVVYNHFGPEGCYLRDFGPYYTNSYNTPWGDAINFDDEYSDQVRNFFISNALYWFGYYHIDALRLDALHQLYDKSAIHFIKELTDETEKLKRTKENKHYIFGECDLNDVRLIENNERGGYQLSGMWNDDFHHAIHTLLTGETMGYYEDFGQIEHAAKGLREGFVYSWEYSKFRKRRYGSSSKDIPGRHFVIFSQNHDQVGNRMLGDRLSTLVPFEALKLEAAILLLSPYLPLLFMGQEYGETAPFLYFVSFEDADLIESVRQGRKKEFEAFHDKGEAPDPQAKETFERSKLNWHKRNTSKLLAFYKTLIHLRKTMLPLAKLYKDAQQVIVPENKNVIISIRRHKEEALMSLFNFEKDECTFKTDLPAGNWQLVLDSADKQWDGPGGLLKNELAAGIQQLTMKGLSAGVYQMRGQ